VSLLVHAYESDRGLDLKAIIGPLQTKLLTNSISTVPLLVLLFLRPKKTTFKSERDSTLTVYSV
jgi:hypothetical protein